MGNINWNVSDDIKRELVDECEKKDIKGGELIVEMWNFYKKHIGKEIDLENKSRIIDSELKKIKEEAEKRVDFSVEDLKKREEIVKEKEVVFLLMKKIL